MDAVDRRLREQIWRGVGARHRRLVWAALIGADQIRAAHSPVWYDECLEVSAGSVVHLPSAGAVDAHRETEQEFAGVCAFIRTASLPEHVLKTDLCRRVLLGFCAHEHRRCRLQGTAQTPHCLTKERMQNCVTAMASVPHPLIKSSLFCLSSYVQSIKRRVFLRQVISFLYARTASEEETFWLFLPLADSGLFYYDDARTVSDLRMIDMALARHAPMVRAHLARLGGSETGSREKGCTRFVFHEMYQPMLTLLVSQCGDRTADGADLGEFSTQ